MKTAFEVEGQQELLRLRNGGQILGYSRQHHNSTFFSKDGFWWNGSPIGFSESDRFSGIRDKNNRNLFEHDIVSLSFRSPFRPSAVYRIRFIAEVLQFVHMGKNYPEGLDILQKVSSIELVSFTFLNTDLVFEIDPS